MTLLKLILALYLILLAPSTASRMVKLNEEIDRKGYKKTIMGKLKELR